MYKGMCWNLIFISQSSYIIIYYY